MTSNKKKASKESAKSTETTQNKSRILNYLTNPDNVGTIQIILACNSLFLTGSYWLFGWIYGVDPLTYTMKYAIEQNAETAAAEFTIIEVSFFIKIRQKNHKN